MIFIDFGLLLPYSAYNASSPECAIWQDDTERLPEVDSLANSLNNFS